MEHHSSAPEALSWTDRYIADDTGPAPISSPSTKFFDIAQVRGVLWRQRFVVGGVIAICLVLGLVATLLMKPMYQARSSVRIDLQTAQIVEGQDLTNAPIAANEFPRYLNTLARVIKSHSMALRVADQLRLDRKADFVEEGKDRQGKPLPRQALLEQAARILEKNVAVDAPGDSRIIEILYTSPDRQQAAQIANAYAGLFVTDDAQRSSNTNSYARKVLEQQIDATRNQLVQAEGQMVNYARANRLIMPMTGKEGSADGKSGGGSSQGVQTITGSTLMAMNDTRARLVADRIATQQRWNVVAGMPALEIPAVQQNAAVQSLQSQRAGLAAQLAQLRPRYRAGYPQIDELQNQIKSLDQQIGRTAEQIKASIHSEYQVAKDQEEAMNAELAQVSNQTLEEQDRQVQYNLLNRNVDALRTQLASLLDRYNQIASASDIRSNNLILLDDAAVPGMPVSPNLTKNMLLALAAGLVLAFGAAMLREILDDSLHSPEDVEAKLGVHLLGITPAIEEDRLEEAQGRIGILTEAYASLRTAVDYAAPTVAHRVIQFTSSQGKEGKTTTAAAMARQYATLGRRVLVIDADLRKPSLGRVLTGRKPDQGLVDVLLGHHTFEEVVVPVEEMLHVLPCGHIPANPVELLSSLGFAEFVERHRRSYDLVLIDSPPVIGLADAVLIGRIADHIVFVVEANRSHFGQAKAAMRRLRQVHAKVVGVVLTKYRAQEAGYSYDYAYTYYSYGKEN